MSQALLILNAGSSSIKFGLFDIAQAEPTLKCKGVLDEQQKEPRVIATDASGNQLFEKRRNAGERENNDRFHERRRPTHGCLPLVGGNDFAVIEFNRAAFARLREPKAIEVIPGASHLFPEPGAMEQVIDHAARWFGQHLTHSAPGAGPKIGQHHAVQR